MADVRIFFVMSIILLFAIIGYFISKKTKLPTTLVIITLGILLGESVFNIATYDGTIAVIAQLGTIILLFIAGLNSNIKDVFNKKNFYVALFGALLPILGGFIVSRAFGYPVYESIFVGATLAATCLGITTAVLKEIGKIKTESAKVMIGAAVIDDIIGLTILSIIISVPQDLAPMQMLSKIFLVVMFVIIMILFGENVLTKILDYFNERVIRHNPKLTFVLALAMVFMFSYISNLIGLAPITGAFLVGVSLSKSKVVNLLFAGSEYFEIVFTSVFFITIGMVVDIFSFFDLLLFTTILTLVAILTKLIGSGYTAYKSGMSKRDSLIVGVGMAPRGEVAFIIALNGLMLGIIGKEIYSAIVFMSFFTTLITLVVLKILYSGEKGPAIEEDVEFIDLKIKR